MSVEEKKKIVLHKLKRNGIRVTKQRHTILEAILGSDYTDCKDIYYIVMKEDPSIGVATVYRTIRMLEDLNIMKIEKRFSLVGV
jgi:Fur family ferric uptake transcriptional regulator